MKHQIKELRQIIDSYKNFVLTTHVNPDGDGIGSEVALACYLKNIGKQVTILNYNSTPYYYSFLAQFHPIVQFDAAQHTKLIDDAEVIITLDINDPSRLLDMKSYVLSSKAFKVCIDHHLEPAAFADLYIMDETATSVGEMLYHIIGELTTENVISTEIAIALYTAIMTDTGSFRYAKTDPETHQIIAQLIQAGAEPADIYEKVYEQYSANRVRLLGFALANLKLSYDGKLAYVVLTDNMFKSTGTTDIDTDAFVPYTLTIGGVQIGLMFSELNGTIKVNFRSKGDIQINDLAKEFGGNGHKNAAGARIEHDHLENIVKQVLERAGSYIK